MHKVSIKNVLFNALVIVTVIAVGFTLFNVFSGAKGYAVTSDSMKDTFNRGDVVFSKMCEFEKLEVGDVVTVSVVNSDGFFTHRIVDIDREKRTVKTKGDNNNSADPIDSPASQIVGKVWYSVPLLGYASIYLSGLTQTTSLIVLAIIATALILINILLGKIQKRRDNGNEQN